MVLFMRYDEDSRQAVKRLGYDMAQYRLSNEGNTLEAPRRLEGIRKLSNHIDSCNLLQTKLAHPVQSRSRVLADLHKTRIVC